MIQNLFFIQKLCRVKPNLCGCLESFIFPQVAKPSADPLVQKRKQEADDQSGKKKKKWDAENLPLDER